MAKRKLEKEREMFMSKSLPGFPPDNSTSIDNENESESDEDSDESEEKGLTPFKIHSKKNTIFKYIFLICKQFARRI